VHGVEGAAEEGESQRQVSGLYFRILI
jgi:hypothetical protein